MKYFLSIFALLCSTLSSKAQDGPCTPATYVPVMIHPTIRHQDDTPPPLVPPTYSPPVDSARGIYWVHGLGGSLNSWAQVLAATDDGAGASFPARRTVGVPPSYTETGLRAAGNSLITSMISFDDAMRSQGVYDFSNNFIIAHSQGGLASRMAEKLLDSRPEESRQHYGIVTFGSAHQGAQIVNSRNSGLVTEFAAGACRSVLTGAALDVLDNSSLIDFFVDKGNIGAGIAKICDGAAAIGLPFAMKDLFAGASNDYAVGAPVLAELQEHDNPATRKVAFYGVEYSQTDTTDNGFRSKQLLWRTMSTQSEYVSNAPTFGANADSALVLLANKTMAEYWASYLSENATVLTLEVEGFPCTLWTQWIENPVECAIRNQQYDQAKDARDLYLNSWQWFHNADAQWKTIIGALHYEQTQPSLCSCMVDGNPIVTENISPVACLSGGDDCTWSPAVIQAIARESDGIVLAESAMNFPGAARANRMEFTNHFQMRNSSATKDALLDLYNNGAGDQWFMTFEK